MNTDRRSRHYTRSYFKCDVCAIEWHATANINNCYVSTCSKCTRPIHRYAVSISMYNINHLICSNSRYFYCFPMIFYLAPKNRCKGRQYAPLVENLLFFNITPITEDMCQTGNIFCKHDTFAWTRIKLGNKSKNNKYCILMVFWVYSIVEMQLHFCWCCNNLPLKESYETDWKKMLNVDYTSSLAFSSYLIEGVWERDEHSVFAHNVLLSIKNSFLDSICLFIWLK